MLHFGSRSTTGQNAIDQIHHFIVSFVKSTWKSNWRCRSNDGTRIRLQFTRVELWFYDFQSCQSELHWFIYRAISVSNLTHRETRAQFIVMKFICFSAHSHKFQFERKHYETGLCVRTPATTINWHENSLQPKTYSDKIRCKHSVRLIR